MEKAITKFNLKSQCLDPNKIDEHVLKPILREIVSEFCGDKNNYEKFRKALRRRLPCFKSGEKGSLVINEERLQS